MRRVHGSRIPGLIERIDPRRELYAVRWDIRRNAGERASSAYGTSYMEETFQHLPTMADIQGTIEGWYDSEAARKTLEGFAFQGKSVRLDTESRLRYTSEYLEAVTTGGANLPLRLGDGEDYIVTMADMNAFFGAMNAHVRACLTEAAQRKAAVDYLLYEEYLNELEDMTELQKAKLEKRLALIRARESRNSYRLEGEEVNQSAYARSVLRQMAIRGESVTLGKTVLTADEALSVLDEMAAVADLAGNVYEEKLRAVEMATETDAVLAVDAEAGYPDIPSVTLQEVKERIATETANSPEKQAVLFAKQVINDVPMTAGQALARKVLFPVWGEEFAEFGTTAPVGFRFRGKDGETLYEVIQEHVLSPEWVPGMETASLYKVVTEEHEGTKDDPIPYTQGMAFEEGKYYTQDGVLYKCILTTQTGYPNDLKDLPTIVEPVTEEEES